jgi:hypothetical protein
VCVCLFACFLQVSASDFSTVKMIGQGAFGTVLLVQKKSNGRLFAMKVCVCVCVCVCMSV